MTARARKPPRKIGPEFIRGWNAALRVIMQTCALGKDSPMHLSVAFEFPKPRAGRGKKKARGK